MIVSFTAQIITQIKDTSGGTTRTLSAQKSLTADNRASVSETIPESTADREIEVSFPVNSDLKALYIKASHDCTLKTNDGSTPDDTISLNAGEYIWHTDAYNTCLLTTAVTSLFITTGDLSGADCTFELEAFYDNP